MEETRLPVHGHGSSSVTPRTRGKYISKACISCRQSKIKCDGGSVCQNCTRHSRTCLYPLKARIRKSKGPDSTPCSAKSPCTQKDSGYSCNKPSQAVLDRLRALEDQLSRVNQALLLETTEAEEELPSETEIFGVSPNQTTAASLSSHIEALKRALHLASSHGTQRQCLEGSSTPLVEQRQKSQYVRNFPSIRQLKLLIGLYFEELNHFFPCIEEQEFMERMEQVRQDLIEDDDGICLVVRPSSRNFFMLMCMVLAVATYLDSASHPQKNAAPPGWQYCLMAEEISGRDHHTRLLPTELDLIRYYTVKAVYMVHIEKLTPASHSIAIAIQSAFAAHLNDESTWIDCAKSRKHARRLLWWTVFYVDRRIAQKCWKPYIIRENEFRVGELATTEEELFGTVLDLQTHIKVEEQLVIARYVQTMIRWARLWAQVWDSMFAVGSSYGKKRAEETEVLDAKILHAQRETHESLCWDTLFLPTYLATGETDAQIRSRLVAYVRFNLLRLLLRQSWKHTTAADARGSQICLELANETIEAIVEYMASQTNPIPFGLNAIECIVECICHLVPHVNNERTILSNTLPMSSFGGAIKFLEDLSPKLGAARRALDALGEIAEKGWPSPFTSNGQVGGVQDIPCLINTSVDLGQGSFNELFAIDTWSEICFPSLDQGQVRID